jgi:hypothetical protein
MNGKILAVLALLLVAALSVGAYKLGGHSGTAPLVCVAGPGTVNPNDICPDDAFYQDTIRLRKLADVVAAGKVKAAQTGDYPAWLQEKMDQLDGMNARLITRLPRTREAVTAVNPQGITHVWSESVKRLVPYQPGPPALTASTPPAKPAEAPKPAPKKP